jgi:hypothetical protein
MCMASRPCCFLFLLHQCLSAQPAGTALHYCLLERERRAVSAVLCCASSMRRLGSCQSGSGTTAGAGIGVLLAFFPCGFLQLGVLYFVHMLRSSWEYDALESLRQADKDLLSLLGIPFSLLGSYLGAVFFLIVD